MSVTSWFLVSSSGTRHRLPREMIFVGREDCELMLQSRSVDKQHAVLNYNPATDEHLVKDLGSLNGTFVNDLRIPDQTYITLKQSDIIRFGYDSHVYVLEKSQHKVPEEALKHEKYSSQLHMSLTAVEEKKREDQEQIRGERTQSSKSLTQEAPVSRPTPLYGQPSWWGEEDYGSKVQSSEEPLPDVQKSTPSVDPGLSGSLSDAQPDSLFPSYNCEPSYFEIPTKDFQHPKSMGVELHEIPTKDTDTLLTLPSTPSPTPPVVQSHASFTIEFDDCTPGKIKIKDHVTKFSTRQRRQQASLTKNSITRAPAEMMSAENKVADWLVHSDVSMIKKIAPSEDVYSTKSDLAVNIKMLKGHHHEDGTQSDSEDPVSKDRSKSFPTVQPEQSERSQQTIQSGPLAAPAEELHQLLQYSPPTPAPASQVASKPLSQSPPQPPSPTEMTKQALPDHLSQQAFIIEFFDDNPRKKRSQSFTHNPANTDSYSTLKTKLERRKGGERPASVHGQVYPTQQVTVPLKGQGHGGPQRSSSLKREKTEGEGASSASTPRSTSGIIIRPFGSIGKKSKLSQEFSAEILKDSGEKDISPTRDHMSPPPKSAPAEMVTPHYTRMTFPQEPPAPSSVSYPTSPSQPLEVLKPPSCPVSRIDFSGHISEHPMSSGVCKGDPKDSQRIVKHEEDDNLSDAGTYTIETESQDKDVEEARNMIDQVFGVLDSPEYSGSSPGVYRPVISDHKDEPDNLPCVDRSAESLHNFFHVPTVSPAAAHIEVPVRSTDLEEPKWVSHWASLADSCVDSGSTLHQEGCLEDLHYMSHSMGNFSYDNSDLELSHSGRTRRLLPQVPPEKLDCITPTISIRHEAHLIQTPSDRASAPTHTQDSNQCLSVQDDVDPDSLSDASRSDDGRVLEKAKNNQVRNENIPLCTTGLQFKLDKKVPPFNKSTCFYIGSDDYPSKPDKALVQTERVREISAKAPPTTVLVRHLSEHETKREGIKANSSAPNLQTQDKDATSARDGCISCFVRQESFTKDQTRDTVQIKKLPHISSQPSIRDMEQKQEDMHDSQFFFQEPACTLSMLETKMSSSGSGRSSKKGGSSSQVDNSLSGESDMDSASTVSQVSGQNAPVSSSSKKRAAISILQKEKSSSSNSIQVKGRQPSARERLSEKRRNQTTHDAQGKADAGMRLQMRRSAGNCGSLDLTKHGVLSNSNDSSSSNLEKQGPSTRTKKNVAPSQKEDNGKTPKTATQQVLTRSNSLSAPRPTRASMLRRARLGEASDNEGTETDRASQSSDQTPAPAKGSAEGKKLSRLDILAMPRKRTGSFTGPSDTESSFTSRSGFSSRNVETAASSRKISVVDSRQSASRGSRGPVKQPLTRTRSTGAKYSSSGTRRRQKGSDFSSSEEEYDANPGTFKSKRSSNLTTSVQTPHSQRTAATRSKSVSLETEEDDDQNDADPYQNWSTHSAEIAKLSQDLAKDLAILAKEIHDVAGDGEPLSPEGGTTTSTSLLPHTNTPDSTISARDELVQHIPEATLNHQRPPPGPAEVLDLDANMNEPEPTSKQWQPWSHNEVMLDNVMLNPVSQLSQAIRENTEQLAEKMKVLFQNKADVWEEIEAKISAESEVPLLRTSNKEIISILTELRRVQGQLAVINTIVEPGGGLQTAAAKTSPVPQTRPSSKQIKPTHRTQTPNASESTKRPSRGPEAYR
ncbi:centrosomal protein of 170 kDa protein B isoform X2 [Oryzias latipes]|uniref:centrosomal protein of 170 kDa protein B isoform X2 n=1 Tax=Oryzias latipes TaxID=8090 RepID=UPI0005CBC249|nr:centrosomal protein of 170 kDa protein B isoform X2 [Oryzias latipes]